MPLERVADRLAEILESSAVKDNIRRWGERRSGKDWDALLSARGFSFAVEWKSSMSVGNLRSLTRRLSLKNPDLPPKHIPLLAVPYMPPQAQAWCAKANIQWLDLSGNARIIVPGLFYQNLGHPNKFRRPGRPGTAFGLRGSRIARRLLIEPGKAIQQRALAKSTGLDEGHTSRIVGKLLDNGLVERTKHGIRASDPDALLDAWREEYRFNRHSMIIQGHVAASNSDSHVGSIAETLSGIGARYAVTALPAAWLYTRHAGFRLATIYLESPPSAGLMSDLGFREEPRGANTWLVVPNDEVVFDGAEIISGIHCVHPVQAYLDLKGHPERSDEAAAELRKALWAGARNDR